MQSIKQNIVLIFLVVGFIFWQGYLYYYGIEQGWLLPVVLLGLYFAIFHRELTIQSLFFLTPLSINIEESYPGLGLYLPTEPICFGLLLLMIFEAIQGKTSKMQLSNHLIIRVSFGYLLVIFLTAIASVQPIPSFKFLLMKLWFIVPFLYYAPTIYSSIRKVKISLYLFSIGMTIVMIYTVATHSQYNFGEKEGHWVMFPFFKDHTIYGCLVAFILPINIFLFINAHKWNWIKIGIGLSVIINLVALFYSYTRAAWLSIVVAALVLLLIKWNIKFKYLLGVAVVSLGFVLINWTSISHSLEKNDAEHTTTDFGERLESAANVTTDASNLERINRWSCAIDMFQEHPILGFGPGTYALEYARFQKPDNKTIISTNFGDGGNAHSEFLGPLAEMGILGLLATIAFISAIFYTSIRTYLKMKLVDSEKAGVLLAIIASFTTYFSHGFLNNYWDTDKACIPIFGFCAIVIAFESQLKELEKRNYK